MSIKQAALFSMHNKQQIEASELAGCFYCCEIFRTKEIKEFTDSGETAICPRCGVDAVLGSASRITLDVETMNEAHDFWFVEKNKKIN